MSMLLSVAASLLVAACGGGSGGSTGGGGGGGGGGPTVTGGGFAPSSGPGDTQNYVPASVGNAWKLSYAATDTNNVTTAGLLALSIPGTKTVLGATATVFDQQDGVGGIGSGQDFYVIGNGGVTFVGNSDATDLLTPQLVPFVQLLFPVSTGQQSRLTASGLSLGKDAQGNPVTLDMTQTISNDRFEDVATTAGFFPGALRQTTTVAGTTADAGKSFGINGTDVRWYWPGAGLIRESISITTDGLSNTGESQIMSYTVNGVSHGVAMPNNVVVVSPNVSSVPNPPAALPVIATDGTSYMAFARRYDGTTGSFTAQWNAVPLSPGGLPGGYQLVSPMANVIDQNVGLHAAAAYDGANYLFVYERENVGAGPSLMGQLVSATGNTVGPAVQLASPNTTQPTLAYDGSRYLLVYRRYTGIGSNLDSLEAAFVTPNSVAGPSAAAAFTISQPNMDLSLYNGSLVFDGTRYFAAWEQTVTTTSGVYAARIGTDGLLPDGAGLLVHAPESANNQTNHQPVAIADNGQYIVVWQDYRNTDLLHNAIYAARVSASGALLDGSATTGGVAVTTMVTDQQVFPTLVHDQGTVLVVWTDLPGAPRPQPNLNYGLRGARLTSNPTALTRLNDDALGFPVLLTAFRYPTAATTSSGTMILLLDPALNSTAYSVDQVIIEPVGP
jgi:hypothetical protein